MSTGSETVTVPATLSPPNFFSPDKFPAAPRHNSQTQNLEDRSYSMTTNPTTKMNIQTGNRDSGSSQQQDSQSGSTIARSMSRYRRRTSSVTVNANATQKINSDPPPPWEPPNRPPVPTIPSQLKTAIITQKESDAPAASSNSSPRSQPRRTDSTQRHTSRRSMAENYHQNRPSTAKSTKSGKSEESTWRRLASRDGRRNRLNSDEDDEAARREIARVEAENNRLLIEQKKKDLARLEVELANTHRTSTHSQPLKPKSPVIEKFVMLTKGRRNKDGLSPGLSPTSSNISIEPTKASSTYIEPGGRGIVPQTDAPHSAINAGDRNVAVRYRQHTLSLEITPETTADDIIIETSKMMGSNDISPENCIVSETYGVLGLERRLRRYEAIRDVMNSWDRDTQNQLIVKVLDSEEEDWDLDIKSVPNRREPPQGIQLYMYHSNRPGKWNKRWITLLDNGQLLSAKKPNANSTDKDTTGLCHLSDYDIYTPTESQMRRNIKPPKRYCFAVKSQQKTTVFMNTENYVQYFSTEDPKIAAQFREKVQGWRSWYLVDRRPVVPKASRKISIRKTDDKPPQISLPAISQTPKKSENVASMNGHRLRVSVDETPYSIGKFEPLLDMKRFDKRLSQFGQDFLPPVPNISTMPKEIPAHHLHFTPKEEKRERKLIDRIHSAADDGFTGNGLLGEGYEERKQAHTETDRPDRGRQRSRDAGFTDGPSLLNRKSEPETPGHKPESPSWFPSALEHSARKRSVGPPSNRPSTSAGVMHHTHSHARRPSLNSSSRPPLPLNGKPLLHEHPNPLSSQPIGMSHSNRREKPKPLVNLEPTFKEAPQWAKGKQGHGVKAPEGTTHLVDLIIPNEPTDAEPDLPARSALRRPPNTAPLPSLSRTRSKTQGAPAPRLSAVEGVPPVPSLPGNMGSREPLKSHPPPRSRERERERPREKDRDYNAYNSVPGRAGTLKVV
ncbi:uncharacterized protein GGS22DRAFT_167993 [Annulohypoxylon maeteangense]|uniref:uncharacterized protein n=1 Tax=Annulohypoxylon maeteangense TaxID=1927788 RepID=UPI002007E068|nr:uncharacterized protein GGS22DRAFT_167993 [Annulohypoxylon maeteangense]KAI0883151.1 hypothetical protein GGS22DRAFT_167993 [Annulohypoxylon maeteangense]